MLRGIFIILICLFISFESYGDNKTAELKTYNQKLIDCDAELNSLTDKCSQNQNITECAHPQLSKKYSAFYRESLTCYRNVMHEIVHAFYISQTKKYQMTFTSFSEQIRDFYALLYQNGPFENLPNTKKEFLTLHHTAFDIYNFIANLLYQVGPKAYDSHLSAQSEPENEASVTQTDGWSKEFLELDACNHKLKEEILFCTGDEALETKYERCLSIAAMEKQINMTRQERQCYKKTFDAAVIKYYPDISSKLIKAYDAYVESTNATYSLFYWPEEDCAQCHGLQDIFNYNLKANNQIYDMIKNLLNNIQNSR